MIYERIFDVKREAEKKSASRSNLSIKKETTAAHINVSEDRNIYSHYDYFTVILAITNGFL